MDGVKLLPKPLPTLVPDAPIKKEDGEEEVSIPFVVKLSLAPRGHIFLLL